MLVRKEKLWLRGLSKTHTQLFCKLVTESAIECETADFIYSAVFPHLYSLGIFKQFTMKKEQIKDIL